MHTFISLWLEVELRVGWLVGWLVGLVLTSFFFIIFVLVWLVWLGFKGIHFSPRDGAFYEGLTSRNSFRFVSCTSVMLQYFLVFFFFCATCFINTDVFRIIARVIA